MGDNIYLGDRNGVRTPMQWSPDRNAGFSRSNPQQLYLPVIIDPEYHYEAINVETQQNNPHSLLWWMKHLIQQRKQFKAFGRGTLEFLRPSNRKVLAFYRRYQDETILVLANLSRFPQHVELDLSASKGLTPVEVFGRAEFPPIGDPPYTITLGSLSFYWFSLEPKQVHQEAIATPATPSGLPLIVVESWDEVFAGRALAILLRRLPAYLKTRRWFQGKDRVIRSVEVADDVPITGTEAHILLGKIEYGEGDPEIYILPGSVATGEAAEQVKERLSDVSVAQLQAQDGSRGILYSAVWDPAFSQALIGAIARRRRFRGRAGELTASHNREFRKAWGERHPELGAAVLKSEQSNTSIAYGDRFILKIYRRIEAGIHPEIEMGNFLAERAFPHIAPLTGSLEYRPEAGESMAVGALHAFVQNQGDAWDYTLDSLSQFLEAALARKDSEYTAADAGRHPLDLRKAELPPHAHELIGTYLDAAQSLGRRTAELHSALSSDYSNPDFSPEAFTDHYRQALYHSVTGLATQTFQLLRASVSALPQAAQTEAQRAFEIQENIRGRVRLIPERRVGSMRIRVHDDLQLSNILHTGKDFIFIGFDGRADRPLGERRIKRSPLRDVASMLVSFQYAADAVFFDQVPGVMRRPEIMPALEFWSGYWRDWVSATFLKGYFESSLQSPLLPPNDPEIRLLLDAFLIERSLEEASRELHQRPEWVRTPLRTLLHVLDSSVAPA